MKVSVRLLAVCWDSLLDFSVVIILGSVGRMLQSLVISPGIEWINNSGWSSASSVPRGVIYCTPSHLAAPLIMTVVCL